MARDLFGRRRNVELIFVGSGGTNMTRGIYVFHIDCDNGEIIKKKFYKTAPNPVSFYRKERFLFVTYSNNTGSKQNGGLWQYASMDLQFGLTANVFNNGKSYVGSYINDDRSYAYAIDYYNGEIIVVNFLKKKIIKVIQEVKHVGSGPHPRKQTEAHPAYIEATPDKKRIFVCDLGTDEVVLYRVDDQGLLTRDDENTIHLTPGSGPRKMIFSPDGQFAYVLNELSSTVCVYRYEDCHFTFVQEISTYPKDDFSQENAAGDILVSESGDLLFATNKGYDSVVAFEIDQAIGKLYEVEQVPTDENPNSLLLFRDKWLVVSTQVGGTIESFEIKRGERKGVVFETHFDYMVGEPLCMIYGRTFD